MRQFLLGLSFSVVFIVGCAVGSMQGSQVAQAEAPQAKQVRAPDGAQRWEYKCVDFPHRARGDRLAALMNPLGASGWEVATVKAEADRYCFKRPLH